MKLYTFETGDLRILGGESCGQLVDLPLAYRALLVVREPSPGALKALPADMLSFLRIGEPALTAARAALAYITRRPALPVGERATYLFDEVKLRPPVLRPGKILCGVLNYRGRRVEDSTARIQENPDFVAKTPNTVIGPGESILLPGVNQQVDCGVELAAVIGRTMPRGTSAHRALEHVVAYTILNDVSSRPVEFRGCGEFLGKNFDTYCPIGPCLTTSEAIGDTANLRLRASVNGQPMQDATTADWIFPLPSLLARLSQVMTLEPGDIIGTGTPAGRARLRQAPVFLKPGDVCRLEIEGIGVLENPVAGAISLVGCPPAAARLNAGH